MTDEKDNIVVGPWGDKPIENNGEWVKKKLDKALLHHNSIRKGLGKKIYKTNV